MSGEYGVRIPGVDPPHPIPKSNSRPLYHFVTRDFYRPDGPKLRVEPVNDVTFDPLEPVH